MELSPMEEEGLSFTNGQTTIGDFCESWLENPLPSETDFNLSEDDRLFHIEAEIAQFLEHSTLICDQDGNDGDFLEGILKPDQSPDIFQEEIPNVGFLEERSLVDLLLMGAEAVEARNWQISSGIIARLNLLLSKQENGDTPFDRLAFFFTQALHFRSLGNAYAVPHNVGDSRGETAGGKTMCATQMVQELSPYIKFAHFTANQAILEATQSNRDIHVVDFDIMEGIQWPPLMADLTVRNEDGSLRITAVIVADPKDNNPCGTESAIQRTGRRLKEFADSVDLEFEFDQVVVAGEGDFRKVKASQSQTIVANCMVHQLHMPSRSYAMVRTFLGGINMLSPTIVVLVQEELFSFTKVPRMSFVEFFCEALHHYMAVSESLARSFGGTRGGHGACLRLVEREILRTRILDGVGGVPHDHEQARGVLWGDRPGLSGCRPIPISRKNLAQAKYLVGLFCGEYWVQQDGFGLALCWKSRPLVTASVWAPISKLS